MIERLRSVRGQLALIGVTFLGAIVFAVVLAAHRGFFEGLVREKYPPPGATVRALAGRLESGEEGDYTWEVNIERYYRDEGGVEEENAPLQLYQIAVNVAWPGRLGEKRYELVTLRSAERRTLTTGTITIPGEDTRGERRPVVIPTPAPRPERRPRGEDGRDGGTGGGRGEGR